MTALTVSQTLIDHVVAAVRLAGQQTLDVYRGEWSIEVKADGNPVTEADRVSHATLEHALAAWSPDVPIISEESELPPFDVRHGWSQFWLIDPLDGTKEFVAGNGEFTVNVALIDRGQPVLGVVYAPAFDAMYFAATDLGTWRQQGSAVAERVYSNDWSPERPARVVESRSHPSAELNRFLGTIPVAERIRLGSSLKFCRVAEGAADLYLRFGPMMEWDAAAGDCVYRCSGRTGPRPSPLRYNQPEFRTPGFILGCDAFAQVREITQSDESSRSTRTP